MFEARQKGNVLMRGTAILKINGEDLLKVQDDGAFIRYWRLRPFVSLTKPICTA